MTTFYEIVQRQPSEGFGFAKDLQERARGATILDAATVPIRDPLLLSDEDLEQLAAEASAVLLGTVDRPPLPINPPMSPLWIETKIGSRRSAALIERISQTEDEETYGVRNLTSIDVDPHALENEVAGRDARLDELYREAHRLFWSRYVRGEFSIAMPQGHLIDYRSIEYATAVDGRLVELPKEPAAPFYSSFMFWQAAFVLAMLHCRNVMIEESRPPRWERRQASKARRAIVDRYYVLKIKPFLVRRAKRDERSPGTQMRALHMVRGHFKTFTADRPLFGRLVGNWWWGSCVRGDDCMGMVTKDYALNEEERP